MAKSLLDIAYDYIEKSPESVSFAELWAHVCKEAGLDEKAAEAKVGQFYTNLTLDGRIVILKNNRVDLKKRHMYEEYHIDMKDAYDDIPTDETETAEEEKSLSGEIITDESSEYEPEEENEDKDSYR